MSGCIVHLSRRRDLHLPGYPFQTAVKLYCRQETGASGIAHNAWPHMAHMRVLPFLLRAPPCILPAPCYVLA